MAAFHLANGHAIMVPAILAALVAYLANNRSGRAALLAEIRLSPRLGPKVAGWVEENETELRRHTALQSREWGAAAYEESSSVRGCQDVGISNMAGEAYPHEREVSGKKMRDTKIAKDAFGNALGDSLAEKISSGDNTLSEFTWKCDYANIGPVDSSAPQIDIQRELAGLPPIASEASNFAAALKEFEPSFLERNESSLAAQQVAASNVAQFASTADAYARFAKEVGNQSIINLPPT